MRKATNLRADNRSTRPGESSGQSVVELGLLLPVLMLILAGTLDLGRIYYSYITIVNAAREGARYGATHPPAALPCNNHAADIVERTKKEAESSGITAGEMTVDVNCPSGSNGFEQPIKVTVRYDFHPILTRILGLGTVGIKAEAQMQIYAQ